MASTTFVNQSTVIEAEWLNEVNGVVWTLFGGSSSASAARTSLGLGTISTQAANNVSITGGSITGITDLAVADGGTGASTAADARNNLNLGSIATVNSPVPIANGGSGQITAALAFAALKQDATTSATGVVELATTAEVQAGTSTTLVPAVDALRAGLLVQGTSVATTSGTSIDFTGIPSWAKRVSILLNQVSTNGTSSLMVQLGDSGGPEGGSYRCICVGGGAGAAETSTSGFVITKGNAAGSDSSGIVTIMNQTSNTWVMSSTIGFYSGVNSGDTYTSGGIKATSTTLDRIRLTTVGGADTFDAGSMNIVWE